eukprot:3257810-Pleurochrysis_carterae.AAC.1
MHPSGSELFRAHAELAAPYRHAVRSFDHFSERLLPWRQAVSPARRRDPRGSRGTARAGAFKRKHTLLQGVGRTAVSAWSSVSDSRSRDDLPYASPESIPFLLSAGTFSCELHLSPLAAALRFPTCRVVALSRSRFPISL